MNELILKVAPVLIAFIIGFIAQRLNLLNKSHADILLKVVIRIGLPALIIISISNIELEAELSLLAISAGLIILLTWPAALLAGRFLKLPRPSLGVFVISPMIMNLAIVYPFAILTWGTEGFAYLALFDFGNALVVFTLVYTLSCWYGADKSHWQVILKGILRFPPFIALFVALIMNSTGTHFPEPVVVSLQWLGRLLLLLVPFALGIYLDTRKLFTPATTIAVILRAGLGLLLGIVMVELFQLEGLMRIIVLVGAIAPIGFNSLVFAAQHHLDKEFAASMASASLILSLIYLPIFLHYV